MNSSVIQFTCIHCQSELTVPAQMAGVGGPCPKCNQHIVSPQVSTPPPAQPAFYAPAPLRSETTGMRNAPENAPQVPPLADPAQQMSFGGSPWPATNIPTHQPVLASPMPQEQSLAWGAPPPPSQHSAAPMSGPMVGFLGMPPPRPPTQPLVQMPRPITQPLYYQPQTTPSVSLQPTLLRPSPEGYINQGPAAAPPQQQPSPVAAAMMHLHQPSQTQQHDANTAATLSRPVTIGGSRLSLLARQLTAQPDGSNGLPPAPGPLSNYDLPGANTPLPAPMPDHSRNRAASNLILQQQVNRGIGVSMSRPSSGRFTKLTMAALLMLSAAGVAVYVMRDSLGLGGKSFADAEMQEPRVSHPAISQPQPGIDPVASIGQAEPKVVYAPPMPPRQMPEPKPQPAIIVPETVETVIEPAPRKAQPVDDEPPVPRAMPIDESPAKPEVVKTAPANETRNLVEIGRTHEDPKVLPGIASSTLADTVENPILKNVPPKCQGALDGLKKFLGAHSLKERLPYMQMASQVERKAAIYYTSNADGPIDVDEIHYLRHDESPQVGKGMHVVFVLFCRSWEFGIPVMVEQTSDGARVDWLSFVEFKDDLLHKFLTNYMDGPVRFHVGIRRTHYFEDDVPNVEEKDTFEVTTPMENVHGFVFVPRSTPLQRSLAGTISWDKEMSWVIVELQWRRNGTAKWIEMTALPQLNWYSASEEAAPKSASASSPVLTN